MIVWPQCGVSMLNPMGCHLPREEKPNRNSSGCVAGGQTLFYHRLHDFMSVWPPGRWWQDHQQALGTLVLSIRSDFPT